MRRDKVNYYLDLAEIVSQQEPALDAATVLLS